MAATKTILLVDDDVQILSALHTLFKTRGYRLLTATDGNRALALAERDAPDLVIIDMIMPCKSGIGVLESLKRRISCPPVIMITGNDAPRQRAYAEQLGVDDFLRKPFETSRLLESVQRLCPLEEPVASSTI